MEKVTKAQVMELLQFCRKPQKSLLWVCRGYHLIESMRKHNERQQNEKSNAKSSESIS